MLESICVHANFMQARGLWLVCVRSHVGIMQIFKIRPKGQ